jgi:hypothetical protein
MNEIIGFEWFIVAIIFIWLIILIVTIASLFKRTDIALPMKVIWLLLILMFPVLGLIVYLIIGRKKT